MPHYKRTKIGSRSTYRSSSTRGKDKGLNCQATSQDRVYCSRNRSYKYAGYSTWLKKR